MKQLIFLEWKLGKRARYVIYGSFMIIINRKSHNCDLKKDKNYILVNGVPGEMKFNPFTAEKIEGVISKL